MDGVIPPEQLEQMDRQQEALRQQFMAGQLLGPRPTTPKTAFSGKEESVYGRRQRRMQEDWDKRYEMQQQQQAEAQKLYQWQAENERANRDQFIQEATFRNSIEEDEAKRRMQAQKELEKGQLLSAWKTLDPRDPQWADKAAQVAIQFPLGMTDEGVKEIHQGYSQAHSIYKDAQKAAQDRAIIDYDRQNKMMQDLYGAGYTQAQIKSMYDTSTPNVVRLDEGAVARALGEAQHKKGEEKSDSEDRALNEYLSAKGQYDIYRMSPEARTAAEASRMGVPDTSKEPEARGKLLGAQAVLERYKDSDKVKANLPHPKTPEDFKSLASGEFFVSPLNGMVEKAP